MLNRWTCSRPNRTHELGSRVRFFNNSNKSRIMPTTPPFPSEIMMSIRDGDTSNIDASSWGDCSGDPTFCRSRPKKIDIFCGPSASKAGGRHEATELSIRQLSDCRQSILLLVRREKKSRVKHLRWWWSGLDVVQKSVSKWKDTSV